MITVNDVFHNIRKQIDAAQMDANDVMFKIVLSGFIKLVLTLLYDEKLTEEQVNIIFDSNY